MTEPRPYHSPLRDRAAAQTRRELIAAGRRLFVRRGYAQVTVADIAREAGTAVKTVYASVGGKAEILREIIETAVIESGADENVAEVRATHDPAAALALLAHGTRRANERDSEVIAIVYGALSVHESTGALWEQLTGRYRIALCEVAKHLDDLGALRAGMTVERGTDLLWYCFGPQSWRTLVGDCGWTWDDAEAQLASTATALLLP
ncbi:TetR/AcrR family transcriptional regulator [Actinomadura craniellae]|uniref:TetR/AcrR family transcriptional regulator n=1 Tax=Actinomadura craniellae TaxID=2231787 RepID=A0A365H508_9ACTN|nr:helix-turn-helix domain-containing protein [Actinomadura craniellae]RAY14187.1 TetR/AcrR family transcriptional regulator [Actinomadura craniellae]